MTKVTEIISPRLKKIPAERICKHCGSSIEKYSGFYAFAYAKSLASGDYRLSWLSGLYWATTGPQQPTRKSDQTVRFDLCAECLGSFIAKRMQVSYPTAKRLRDHPVTLPPHVQTSPEETAAATRLVRLMRSENSYWLRFFVEWLLFRDATEPMTLSIKDAEAMLTEMKNLVNWTGYLENLKAQCPAMAHHPSVAWVNERSPVVPEEESEQFYELVRMWRLNHPEPPKRLSAPAGHLGREESGD